MLEHRCRLVNTLGMKTRLIRFGFFILILIQLALVGNSFKKNIPFEIQSLLGPDNPIRQQYENDLKSFNDETTNWIVVEKNKDRFSVQEIAEISKKIAKELEMNYGVESILGPHNAKFYQYDKDGIFLTPFIIDNVWSPDAEAELFDPLWKNQLIRDGQKAFIISFKTTSQLLRKEEQPVLNQIETELRKIHLQYPNVSASMLGAKVASAHFLTEMQFQQRVITPALLLAIAVFFYFCFGSWQIIFWSFFTLFFSYTSILILIIFTEGGLGPYSSFALMFSFIIATTDLIHFFGRYQQLTGSMQHRLNETLRIAWMPCLLTSLTTAAGFFALIMNQNLPIRYFGLYCAFGCILEWFLIFYVLPILMPAFNFNPKENSFDSLGLSKKMDNLLNRYSKQFVVWTFVFLAAGTYFSFWLKIDDNFYTKFKENHSLSKTLQQFSRAFDFVGSINVIIKPTADTNSIFSEKLKTDFQQIEKEILAHPEVSKISSLSQVYDNLEKKISAVLKNPVESNSEKVALLNIINNYGILNEFYNERAGEYRTTVFLKSLSTDNLNSVLSLVEKISAENKASYFIRPSGFSVIRSYINGRVISDFFESFILSFFLIFLCYLFLYKNLKWAFFALIPNAVPLLAVSGLMGLSQIPVDTNLVILICIAFGIAGDNTVHLTYVIRQEQHAGRSYNDALQNAFKLIGIAMIATNAVFLFCLPIFMLGSLKLFNHIAIFLSIAFIFAFIADVFMFPALQKSFGWTFSLGLTKKEME